MPVLDLQKKSQVENIWSKMRSYHQSPSGSEDEGGGSGGFIVTYGSNPLRQRVLLSGILGLFLKLPFI